MEINDIFLLFADVLPKEYHIQNTSHGTNDFREAIFATYEEGVLPAKLNNRLVIKLADNGFTDHEHLLMWERLTLEYRKKGFYCPEYIRTKNNDYPIIQYKEHQCIVYAEESSLYKTADSFEKSAIASSGKYKYLDQALRMNAAIAASHFNFSELPSGYALFDLFDPADLVDEVMGNAQAWQKCVQDFPSRFDTQIQRIWKRWWSNREYLKSRYNELPTSIFQADINSTNILLNENADFVGVLDFNLAGKDTFINYLFREIPYVFGESDSPSIDNEPPKLSIKANNDGATSCIIYAINIIKKIYTFSEAERELALPLYRCIRPLWFTVVERFRKAKTEDDMQNLLDEVEQIQTMEIDFYNLMK